MSATPYMKFFNGDFLRKTMHLGPAEIGAYFLLIMAYFESGGLPDDEAKLMRITRMTPRQWAQSRDTIKAFFEDGWRHSRVDEERDALMSRAATNRKNGSIGGRSKVAKTRPPEDEFSQHHNGKKASDFNDGGQANASISLKHSQYHSSVSESERESPNGDSPLSRENCDAIESRCREAAGLQQSPSPSLMDLSAVLGWIREGADLETDILPTLRAARGRGSTNRVQTWRYFTGRVLEARDTRLQMRETRPVAAPQGIAGLRADNAARIASAFDAARARLAEQGRDA